MASEERFVTVDSAAFMDRFPGNTAWEFSNLLFPPIDNRNYDLEMRVLDISLLGNQTPMPTCFDIVCDLIDPYQKGDSMTQTLMTFLPRRKLSTIAKVAQDDHYTASNYTYARLRESHTEFDRFTVVKLKIERTFGERTTEQVAQIKGAFAQPPQNFDLQRVIIRLHVRKAARPSAKEAESLFLARI